MLYEHNLPVYAALKEMLNKTGKAILVTATGTGKSHIVLEYLKDNNYRALVVSPRLSINRQWEDLSALIDTVTYQSFISLDIDQINSYDCVVFDEAHHCGSPIWGAAVRLFMDQAPMPVIGLTADSKRWTDGGRDIAIELWDGSIVRGFDQGEAIQQGILPRLTYVSALFDCAGMSKRFRENNQVSDTLKKKLDFTEKNCESVVSILQKHIPQTGRKGIVFAPSVKETPTAETLMREAFPQIPVLHAHSGLPQEVISQNIRQFKMMPQGFLITVDMLNEGVHIAGIDTIVMLRRTVSPNLYMQQCGRGLASGGKNPVIFDFVGNQSSIKSVALRIDGIKETYKREWQRYGPAVSGEQVIVYDYTRDFLSVIDEIKSFLSHWKHWTPEEDDILKKYYQSEKGKVATRLPGRSPQLCSQRAMMLGLSTPQQEWSDDELQILKKYYPEEGSAVYKRLPDRTPGACISQARRIKLRKNKHITHVPWTEEEDAIIKAYYLLEGANVQKRVPNHTVNACHNRAWSLGIRRRDSEKAKWTENDDEILRQHYLSDGPEVCARLLNRAKSVVKSRAKILKLYRGEVRAYWTDEEDSIIKEFYPSEGSKVSERLTGRSRQACVYRARKLGLA